MAYVRKTTKKVATVETDATIQINTKQYRVTVFRLEGCLNDRVFRGARGDVIDLLPHEALHLQDQIEEI